MFLLHFGYFFIFFMGANILWEGEMALCGKNVALMTKPYTSP